MERTYLSYDPIAKLGETIDKNNLEVLNVMFRLAYPDYTLVDLTDIDEPETPVLNDCYIVIATDTVWGKTVEKNDILRWDGTDWQILDKKLHEIYQVISDAEAARVAAEAARQAAETARVEAGAVLKEGDETIGGVKTFESSPILPDATAAQHPVTKNVTDKLISDNLITTLIDDEILTKFTIKESVAKLDKTYTFFDDGDSFEFDIKLNGDIVTNFNALGIIGTSDSVKNHIGWISQTEFRIRDNAGVWIAFTGLPAYNTLGEIVTVKAIINGSNIDLYFNGSLVSSKAKTSVVYINQVGNVYSTGTPSIVALFSMRNLKIHSARNGDLDIKHIWSLNTNANTEIQIPDKLNVFKQLNAPVLHVIYNTTGGTGSAGLFTVYQQINAYSKYYFKININRDLNVSTRSDLWRIRGAYLSIRNQDGTFTDTSYVLLNAGETEFAYKRTGKTDFTGGYHGDQKLISANFFADGLQLDLTSSFEIDCKEFSYIMKSNMYETDNATDVVDSVNLKHTIIDDRKITIYIDHKWTKAVQLESCYNTLVPLYFDVSEYFTNETAEIAYLPNPSVSVDGNLYGESRRHRCWNQNTGLSATINSYFKVDIANAKSRVWSSANSYNKLYVNYSPANYITSINEMFISRTEICFNLQ